MSNKDKIQWVEENYPDWALGSTFKEIIGYYEFLFKDFS